MITVLAASLMAVPQVTTRTARNIVQAYPISAMRQGKSGAVTVRIWIDPRGQVYRCEPLQLVGDAVFKQAACKDHRRWRVGVAKAADGTPAYGVLTMLVKYFRAHDEAGDRIQALPDAADMILRVSSNANQSYPDVRVVVEVASDGTITHCEGIEGTADALTQRVCAAAIQQRTHIATDAAGNPVPYVEPLLVRIETSSKS